MQIWIFVIFTCLITLGFLIYCQNNRAKTGGSEKLHVIKLKDSVIAHLAGSSGVGKTYQAKKLAEKYKDVIFADLDEILEKVSKTKKNFPSNAKLAIEKFIAGRTNIILVGYNDYIINDTHYWIEIPTVNRFFLTDNHNLILERRITRYKKIKKNNPTTDQVVAYLEEIKYDEKLYKKNMYHFMDLNRLLKEIIYQVNIYRKNKDKNNKNIF